MSDVEETVIDTAGLRFEALDASDPLVVGHD
jgi:hypothetical protein